ncbi:MAG: hypothetical protein CW345_06765 [Firmicutes bacterium]|nr:hypothetical protein [Bacillota bacterium]MBO2521488.1 hypothetical protein [Bacillota bacterium]
MDLSLPHAVEVESRARPGEGKSRGVPGQPGPAALHRPLARWIAEFLEDLARREARSENTLRHYAHDLDLFTRYLKMYVPGVETPEDIDSRVVTGFFRYLRLVRGNSAASSRRRLASLRRFFAYLERQGAIPRDPSSAVPAQRVRSRPSVTLTRDEALRLLEAAKMSRFPARDYAMFRLFLTCGCTLSELLSLKLDDFDPAAGTITFTGRRGRRRTLGLSPACRQALAEYLAQRPKAPASRSFFLNRRGEPVTKGAVYHAFRLAVRRAGIERPGLTVHSLRRTCLTLLWEAGVSLRALQQVAGHASLSSTRTYARSKARGANPHAWKWNHPLDG